MPRSFFKLTRLFLLALLMAATGPAWLAPPPALAQEVFTSTWQPWMHASGSRTLPWSGTLLRASLTAGEGVGHDSSFLTLGGMHPMWLDDHRMFFIDAQGLLYFDAFDDKNASGGANVGLGYRRPGFYREAIVGASVWYDVGAMRRNTYQQIGLSLESLGDTWDFRSNLYLPIGTTRNLVELTPMSGPVYRGINMFFLQQRWEERALKGADAEVGRRILGDPVGPQMWAYGGYYYYDGDGPWGPNFSGIRGRLWGQLTPDLSMQLLVTYDTHFETNATFGLTYLAPVSKRGCCPPVGQIVNGPVYQTGEPTPAGSGASPGSPGSYSDGPAGGARGSSVLSPRGGGDAVGSGVSGGAREARRIRMPVVRGQCDCFPMWRYLQPVNRMSSITVTERIYEVATIVTDPTTGLPIDIIHVNSNAAPGGDGTVENPFQTLAEAQAEANTGNYDIVFAHADSVFNGEQITLPADIRFLGEGIDHLVNTTEQGTILLPRATAGTNVPVINAAPDNAVTVNSNDEVSGFTITNPVAAGIYANNVAGPVNINRNTIDGGVNGINIVDSTGTFTVTQTTIKNTTGTAFNVDGGAPNITSSADITNNLGRLIAVTDTTGGTIKFEGGVLVDNGGDGILVQNSNSLLTITAATLNNSTGNAVDIVNSPGITTLNNLVINSPTAAGIDILDSNAVVNGAKIDNTTTQGIVVTNLNNNRTVDLLGNTLTHIGSIGLELNIDGTGTLTSNVANNNVTSTGTGFDARTSAAGGDLTLKFDNNTLASTLGAGAIIDGTGPGDVTITSFLNNNVTSAGAGGILVTEAVFDANPAVAGFQMVAGGVSALGSSGTRVAGDGLNLQDVQGGLSYTGLTIFNNQGTGLNVVGNSVFDFNVTAGSVDTTNGQALNAASATLATTFTGLKSTNSPTNGIRLNGVAGTLTSGSTTVNDPTNDGLFVENSPGFTADFGATTITGTGVAGGAVGRGVVLQNNPGGTFKFGTLGVTTDNGAGFVAQNSGTVNLGAPASVAAVGGPAVVLDNTRGITAGSPGWGFTTLSSTASTTQGLYLHDLDDPFTVSGTTTVNGAALTSILIDGDTNATFAATNILNRGGAGIDLNTTTGAIAFGATTISGAGAGTPGVDYSDSTSGSLKFASLSVSGSGGPSVNLTNNAGAFEVTGATTINASQGVGIDVNGGTGGVTFGSVAMTNRFNSGIDINGGSQTITFGATSIDNPNLSGTPAISITNVTGGSIALASATINNNNAVADGIRLVGNTAPVTVGGGSISGAAGRAVAIDGGSADVNIAATISNNQGRAVDIMGRAGGVVAFSGAINDAGAGAGIHITAPIAPNVVNFTAPVNLGTPANRLTGDTALLVDNGGFGPNQTVVKFANLNIYSDRKIGIDASNGGTLQIDAGTVNTTGTGATGVKLDGIESLITLSSLTVDNIGSTNPAVDLQDVTGAFNVTGATTLGATGPIGRGVDITGGNADITFAATTIKNRYAEGINVDGTAGNIKFGATTINGPGDPSAAAIRVADTVNGAVVFDSVTVSGGTGEGLLLVNNAANFNVTGATVVSNNATVGVDIQGGSGNVTFNALNLTNTSGTGLKSDGLTGLLSVASGTITNANGTAVDLNDTFMNVNLTNVTATNGSALRVTGNSTGTLAVSGTTKVTNGLAESIYVSGGNTDVLLGAVNIANTAGVGIYVHDSTGLFQTTSGSVANTGGAAIDIANSTLNMTLTSASSKGATTGLELSNTAGSFTISGGGGPGTGGTIQNAFTGVLLANAPNVTINDLTVSSVLGNGFELNGGTTNVTLSGVTVTSTGGNAIHADNVSTLNINNATVSTTSPGMAAVLIEDSSKVNINGGTITDPDAAVRLVASLDVKVANATLNGSGAGDGVDVIGSDNVVIDKNTINNTAKGVYVESTGVDITTTITGNKINTATTGIDINGAVGTIYLNGGQLTPVPDPAANNVITGFTTDINAAGSYSGKLQVNGVARP